MDQWRPQLSLSNKGTWIQQEKNNFDRNKQFQNSSSNYRIMKSIKNCNYCKKLGHTIEECRHRAYNLSLK